MKKKKERLFEEPILETFEDKNAARAEATAPQEDKGELSPREIIAQWERENAEGKEKSLRSMAEFENYRRRSIQEKSDWIKLATQNLAQEVCDVMDNFERALAQLTDADREHSFIKGVMQIEQQLRSVLGREGVCKIEAQGKEFDPSLHEALAHIPSEFDANLIAAVIQNGYTMHDKVLRPVRVAVSSGKFDESQPATEPPAEDKPSGGNGSDRINIEVK